MSSFKKNRVMPNITERGNSIINSVESTKVQPKDHKYVKAITIPFTQEMSELLDKIFNHFEGDISRRKLCSRYLVKALRSEVDILKLN